jgi:dTDP-4-dehydrorhamnose reductase
MLSKFYIVRTSGLFGLAGRNFVDNIISLGKEHGEVFVVTDEKGCPTWTRHLAQAVVGLVDNERYGIYHVANSGETTWYGFATEIFRLSGMDVKMTAITAADFARPAKRPSNSVLAPDPLPQVLGRQMPHWREALEEYLNLRKELSEA